MKSFAILLIILNIGFFTWLQGWLDWMPWQPQDIVPPTQTAKPSKSDLPTLALLNEKIEKPVTVASAEQTKPEPVKPEVKEVKAEPPKPAKPETITPPVEKVVVATETTPAPVKPEPAKVDKPETAPVATVETPKVAVTETAKTVEPAPVKTEVEKPTAVVETLAHAAKTPEPVSTPEVKEIKTSEKSEAMQIPPPAVITPENNPITSFVSKAKAVVTSSSAEKPSDTGISAPPKAEVKESAIEQTATPTTTVLNALPAEVLNAMSAAKTETPAETQAPATSKNIETGAEKTAQSSNSSSTLAKNSATIPSSSPVAEGSMKSLQAVKKEDKTSLKSNNSNELCFVAGPYPQLSNAQSSAKWFRGKSKVQAEIQTDDVPMVFWVYLPPYKNQKEANRQAQHLAHLGITDYVLVTTGKLKHAVSLGVYRDQASAQRRVDELHRKGYKRARLEKQRQGNKRYWLSVKMPATQKDLMVSFKRAQKISAIEVNVCE